MLETLCHVAFWFLSELFWDLSELFWDLSENPNPKKGFK
jgi:hypothetical protein